MLFLTIRKFFGRIPATINMFGGIEGNLKFIFIKVKMIQNPSIEKKKIAWKSTKNQKNQLFGAKNSPTMVK